MLVINPNPCFDRTLHLDQFAQGAVMRSESAIVTAGGKGINVARVVRAFGEIATLALLIGEVDREPFIKLLKDEGADFIYTTHSGIVRVATLILEKNAPTTTVINERGSTISKVAWREYVGKISHEIHPGELVACMGSFPNGVDQDSLNELVSTVHAVGGKILIDSSPEYLAYAIKAGVDIVHPNLDEAESLLYGKDANLFTGDTSDARARAEKAAALLILQGPEVAFVTAGEVGVAVATREGVSFIEGTKIELVSAIGAGDSFVAGVLLKYQEWQAKQMKVNWREIAAFGTATAAASCEQLLSGGVNPTRVLELFNKIQGKISEAHS